MVVQRLLSLLIIGLLLGAGWPARAATPHADSLLARLNQVLDQRTRYERQRMERLVALKAAYVASAGSPVVQFGLGRRICDEYQSYQYDSAFVYCRRLGALAARAGRPDLTAVAQLRLAFVLLSSGLFTEAFATLAQLDYRRLGPADRVAYYLLQARAYSDLGTFDQDDYYRPANYARSLAYADTAARLSTPATYSGLAVRAFLAQKHQDLAAGRAVYQAARRLPGLTRHQLAVSASTLASLYETHRQPGPAFELLLTAAIADVESATTETLALFKVSDYCYRQGNLAAAYRFIREARREAAFYKARQRQVELSHVSFLIEGQKTALIEQQRQQLRRNAWGLATLAVFGLACALVILAQLRRLQRADRQVQATNQELQAVNNQLQQLNLGLHEANRVKDEYIGYYLSSNSQAIDRLEQLKRSLLALLATKQYTGLQKLLDGVNIRQERQELFRGFDQVFLQLFPGFVAAFNTLFRAEDHLHLTEEQLLTPELRIFALVRLGIEESERISRILGYSINTIYTYKTRVKSRSLVPNDEFESRVRTLAAE